MIQQNYKNSQHDEISSKYIYLSISSHKLNFRRGKRLVLRKWNKQDTSKEKILSTAITYWYIDQTILVNSKLKFKKNQRNNNREKKRTSHQSKKNI